MGDPTPGRFALDKDKLAQENKAIGVFLNPPRYWMFDEFSVFEAGDDGDFGGIKMTWMGVVDVATLKKAIIGGNYFPRYIHRDNSYTFNLRRRACHPRQQAHGARRLEVPGQDPGP